MRIIFALALMTFGVLGAFAGDLSMPVIFGVLALIVAMGFGRFVRLVAGLAMILRAFAG